MNRGFSLLELKFEMTRQNNTLGILLSFGGYTSWVASDIVVKLASKTLPMTEILAFNFFIGSLFMLAFAAMKGGIKKQMQTKRPVFHFLRSFLTLTSTYGAVGGIIYLSLADFYTIIFTSPLILTALGSFFLKEKATLKMWLAILFGFAGVLLAVRYTDSGNGHLPWIGVAATSLASLTLAWSMLTTRNSGSESNLALAFWPEILGCIVSISILLWMNNMVFDIRPMALAGLSGIFGSIGVLLTNTSLRLAPVAVVSPYHYTQIIGGALAGYLIWNNVPGWSIITGAIMVTLSGLYILHAEARKTGKASAVNKANFPA